MEQASSPAPLARPERDPRASLQNLLSEPTPPPPSPKQAVQTPAPAEQSTLLSLPPPRPPQEIPSGHNTPVSESTPQNDAAMTTTTRRNAAGTVSSVYSGNRIKYLKKDDGIPFWRRDIQYTLLRMIFEDDKRVFTRFSDADPGHTFAEVYIDAMANSSKCSQILKDKLLSDRWEELGRPEPTVVMTHSPALEMAMVCLLVNVGRMNTTINFFPEMRARVRTFHSIPCLQAGAGPAAYKQLQDGPRLKSILKGALEDVEQPSTVPAWMDAKRPRANPVSLVFMFANFAPKISELHFPPSRDFFDLFMRDTLSSRSRATAFLSLMWWYMESDFSAADAKRNPYGGTSDDNHEKSFRIPPFDMMSEEEAAKENEDPPEELEFGETKRKEREVIMANDEPPMPGTKRGKGSKEASSRQANMASVIESNTEIANIRKEANQAYLNSRRSPDLAPRFTAANSHAPIAAAPPYSSRLRDRSQSPPLPGRSSRMPRGESDKPADTATRKERGDRDTTSHHSRGKRPLRPIEASNYVLPSYRDQSQASAYEYRPKPVLAPAINPYQPHPQYSHSGSPYGSGHSLAPNGSAHEQNHAPPGARESRLTSGNALTQDQQRFEKTLEAVEEHLHVLQKARRREKRRRGVFSDSWIKARSVPDGWDTEEDEEGRMGGMHDLRLSSDASVLLRVGDSSELRQMNWNIVDKGHELKRMADMCRHLSKRLKNMDVADRAREAAGEAQQIRQAQDLATAMRSRSSARQDLDTFNWQQGQGQGQGRQYQDIQPATEHPRHVSSFPLPPSAEHTRSPAQKRSHTTPFSFPAHIPNADESPQPDRGSGKKRRRRKQSYSDRDIVLASGEVSPSGRSTTSGAVGERGFSWVPKGRKRKDSDLNPDAAPLRPGEMGIPTNVFFSDKRVVDVEQSVMAGPQKKKTRGLEGGADTEMEGPAGDGEGGMAGEVEEGEVDRAEEEGEKESEYGHAIAGDVEMTG